MLSWVSSSTYAVLEAYRLTVSPVSIHRIRDGVLYDLVEICEYAIADATMAAKKPPC